MRHAPGVTLLNRMRNKNLTFLDKTTPLHYDHISKTGGASGVWKTQLSQKVLDALLARYGW